MESGAEQNQTVDGQAVALGPGLEPWLGRGVCAQLHTGGCVRRAAEEWVGRGRGLGGGNSQG